ncbi:MULTISPECIES: ABC transporter ATP-binding protein [Kytococcus]|uniref:ABC transporter ATP-binding protein n=1 Tax=Kytococcus schroeteri TaxID=138300 RepID=A0A2I1PDA4_9MICO|nr:MULTISPECIES: ABC transporter ATP-binding protein [Kytococcus]OFS15032.1 ABC transporter ATP-binding protein [Kytococcus sp. HMSC28H12]PKZ42561.1 ABC transporter ATP-binding protein [Kytococcus schroeteri]
MSTALQTDGPTPQPTGRGAAGDARGARVEVRNLSKHYGSFKAVDDLSFTVEPGRITGFLGPNGAGKTTTLRMLLGLISKTSGTATIDGHDYKDLARPLHTVGAALEATGFHPARSGRNHLRTIAATHGIPDSRVDEIIELVGIPAASRKKVGGYSMGMRQRLGLGVTLLGDPKVLVMDEPANGLDPQGIRWLRDFLRHMAHEQGKTVLISSHMLSEVQQTVDDVVIIANGRMVTSGSLASLDTDSGTHVVTRDAEALARVLAERGVRATVTGPTTLDVESGDAVLIGDTALAAGQPIHGLSAASSSLEDMFVKLTDQHGNRNTEV